MQNCEAVSFLVTAASIDDERYFFVEDYCVGILAATFDRFFTHACGGSRRQLHFRRTKWWAGCVTEWTRVASCRDGCRSVFLVTAASIDDELCFFRWGLMCWH